MLAGFHLQGANALPLQDSEGLLSRTDSKGVTGTGFKPGTNPDLVADPHQMTRQAGRVKTGFNVLSADRLAGFLRAITTID